LAQSIHCKQHAKLSHLHPVLNLTKRKNNNKQEATKKEVAKVAEAADKVASAAKKVAVAAKDSQKKAGRPALPPKAAEVVAKSAALRRAASVLPAKAVVDPSAGDVTRIVANFLSPTTLDRPVGALGADDDVFTVVNRTQFPLSRAIKVSDANALTDGTNFAVIRRDPLNMVITTLWPSDNTCRRIMDLTWSVTSPDSGTISLSTDCPFTAGSPLPNHLYGATNGGSVGFPPSFTKTYPLSIGDKQYQWVDASALSVNYAIQLNSLSSGDEVGWSVTVSLYDCDGVDENLWYSATDTQTLITGALAKAPPGLPRIRPLSLDGSKRCRGRQFMSQRTPFLPGATGDIEGEVTITSIPRGYYRTEVTFEAVGVANNDDTNKMVTGFASVRFSGAPSAETKILHWPCSAFEPFMGLYQAVGFVGLSALLSNTSSAVTKGGVVASATVDPELSWIRALQGSTNAGTLPATWESLDPYANLMLLTVKKRWNDNLETGAHAISVPRNPAELTPQVFWRGPNNSFAENVFSPFVTQSPYIIFAWRDPPAQTEGLAYQSLVLNVDYGICARVMDQMMPSRCDYYSNIVLLAAFDELAHNESVRRAIMTCNPKHRSKIAAAIANVLHDVRLINDDVRLTVRKISPNLDKMLATITG